jgi:hypothetical protein
MGQPETNTPPERGVSGDRVAERLRGFVCGHATGGSRAAEGMRCWAGRVTSYVGFAKDTPAEGITTAGAGYATKFPARAFEFATRRPINFGAAGLRAIRARLLSGRLITFLQRN